MVQKTELVDPLGVPGFGNFFYLGRTTRALELKLTLLLMWATSRGRLRSPKRPGRSWEILITNYAFKENLMEN